MIIISNRLCLWLNSCTKEASKITFILSDQGEQDILIICMHVFLFMNVTLLLVYIDTALTSIIIQMSLPSSCSASRCKLPWECSTYLRGVLFTEIWLPGMFSSRKRTFVKLRTLACQETWLMRTTISLVAAGYQ